MSLEHSVNLPMPDGSALRLPLPPSDLPPDDVLRALAVYSETGNQTTAATATGVSQSCISKWVNSENGVSLGAALRDTLRAQFAYQHRQLMQKSIDETMTRLEHGDPVVTRQGTVKMVPVKARDAMLIHSIAFDKYLALTAVISGQAQVNKLEELAARLERSLDSKANKNHSVIDVSPHSRGEDAPGSPARGEGENNNEGKNA